MNNKTLGIIYAIKRSEKQWDKAVSEYMADYSGSPNKEYSEWELNRIMRVAFIDYIETCDKPYAEVRELLEIMDRYSGYSMGHYLANVLGQTKVKEQGKYVNGFRDVLKDTSK